MEILAFIYWLTSPITYERPPEPEQIMITEVSAYTNRVEETDSTPNITANGDTVYEGGIACPRYIDFGTVVEIAGEEYTCNDRMNRRYKHNFDIFMFDYDKAINFGRQTLAVTIK